MFPTFDPILDGIITVKELRDALNKLKNNKAPGPDRIPSLKISLSIKSFAPFYQLLTQKNTLIKIEFFYI